MKDVAVYILTYNRPQKIVQSLKSVCLQEFKEFDIIVSDNSTNSDTQKIIAPFLSIDKRIKYIRRGDLCPSGIQHLNYIIKHNEYKYFMMFHDDDEMLPNMVGCLYNKIKNNSQLAAVCTNAYYVKNEKNNGKLFISSKVDILIQSPQIIALKYVNGGTAPFPSYMYNRDMVSNLMFDTSLGGKYCDAAFVVSLLCIGELAIIAEPCMKYNISEEQDSQHHEFSQYLQLIKFMRRYLTNREILPMRIYNLYNQTVSLMRLHNKLYFRKKLFFLFLKESPFNYFLKYCIRLLGYRR